MCEGLCEFVCVCMCRPLVNIGVNIECFLFLSTLNLEVGTLTEPEPAGLPRLTGQQVLGTPCHCLPELGSQVQSYHA